MIYARLFLTFFKIGLFNFGGGYAMISFIQNEVVLRHGWLTTAQFTDMVAVSQVTPGPVGINMATYTGYTATGSAWGAAIATTAVCLPSFLLMFLLGKYLLKNQRKPRIQNLLMVLRLTVVGLIASSALLLCNAENFIDYKSILFFVAAFVLVWTRKAGPIAVLLASAAISVCIY